jgi:protein SCO1/2
MSPYCTFSSYLTASFAAILLSLAAYLARAEDADSAFSDIPLRTEWVAREKRTSLALHNIAFANQNGEEGVLNDLADRPLLITFFYTRCQNNYKCSAALTRFTALQQTLQRLGLAKEVRLMAITYEPGYDDSARLKSFGAHRGLRFTENVQAIRLDETKHEEFVRGLNAPVSFNGGAVNTHGVALHVLDARGRLARQYHTLLWDNDQVVEDVRRLLAEDE